MLSRTCVGEGRSLAMRQRMAAGKTIGKCYDMTHAMCNLNAYVKAVARILKIWACLVVDFITRQIIR